VRSAALVPLLVVTMVAGCSGDQPPVDPWAADLEAAYAQAKSDQLKAILEDRKITAPEYDDAVQQYVKCMNDAFPNLPPDSFRAERGADGLVESYKFTAPTEIAQENPETDRIETECNDKHLGRAVPLYEEQRRNPERLSPFELTKQCLVAAGLADGSYTEKNWKADRYHDSEDRSGPDSGPVPDKNDATELDFNSPEVQKCRR
jgi:hypothetical protein